LSYLGSVNPNSNNEMQYSTLARELESQTEDHMFKSWSQNSSLFTTITMLSIASFEALMTVTFQVEVFWAMTSCSVVV